MSLQLSYVMLVVLPIFCNCIVLFLIQIQEITHHFKFTIATVTYKKKDKDQYGFSYISRVFFKETRTT